MNFDTALTAFVAAAQALVNKHFAESCPTLNPPRIEVGGGGKKYIRIAKVETTGSGCSVYCFVERETGDVLKADSWKRPAKGTRGNIFAANNTDGVTAYGVAYNR